MIRVTVEILPGGCAKARRTIALMRISNVSDLARWSDYRGDLAGASNRLSSRCSRPSEISVVARISLRAEGTIRGASPWFMDVQSVATRDGLQ